MNVAVGKTTKWTTSLMHNYVAPMQQFICFQPIRDQLLEIKTTSNQQDFERIRRVVDDIKASQLYYDSSGGSCKLCSCTLPLAVAYCSRADVKTISSGVDFIIM